MINLPKILFLLSASILIVNIHSQNLLNGPDDIVFDEKHNRYLIGNWGGNMIVALVRTETKRSSKQTSLSAMGWNYLVILFTRQAPVRYWE